MNLEKNLGQCARCGFCRRVCPVFKEKGGEAFSPRGKVFLLNKLLRERTASARLSAVKELIFQCTLCGACAETCPVEIDILSVWLDTRRKLASAGHLPGNIGKLLPHLAERHNISTLDNLQRTGWWDDLEEEVPSLDRQTGAEVLYFTGCLSSFYPAASSIAGAVVEILGRSGVAATTLGSQEWCCGYPLMISGQEQEAAFLKQHNLELIKELGIHSLITGCPSCLTAWRQWYLPDLGDYPLEVLHVSEYLARLLDQGRLVFKPWQGVVTYHDPCDLGRHQGVFAEPRQLLRAVPGLELVEMSHNRSDSMCCGGGGNLQSVDPGLSAKIAGRRVESAAASGATILTSACPQCKQMLGMQARSRKLGLRVLDIVELLNEIQREGTLASLP